MARYTSIIFGSLAAASLVLAPPALADPASAVVHMTMSGPIYILESELPTSPVSQQNAVRAAKDYLAFGSFSRQGLIEQLEYDGFSTADATFAVDHITVDWNQQAAKAAKDYLNFSAFSRSGLIDQLEYDGFTPAQATYGASAAGL